MQKETPMAIEMPTIHRSRTAIAAFVTVLTFALSAPLAVNAQEQVIAEELVVAAEDTVPALAPIAVPAVTGTSGDGVRTTRAIAAERALLTGDIGSMQEEHLRAIVAAAPSWDETSGYGAVEASRADVSTLLSGEVISGQEQGLAMVAAAAKSWDETSGYGSVEASRATMPIAVDAEAASAPQTITIHDERSGDGPCGFLVERTLDGTVALVPSIDVAGNLILLIEPVTLHGTLSNPATGKAVELRWVRSNGVVDFGYDGTTTTVALALDGHFFRGYDGGRTDLTMMLPVDGAERLVFEVGQRSADPWSHVCGLLA
jgi:hypothetical protein